MPFVTYATNGALCYSKEFILELFRRHPGDSKLFGELTEECPIYGYVEPPCPPREIRAGWAHIGPDLDFLQTDTGLWLSVDYARFDSISLRTDERIIELIRERGLRFASTKYSKLAIAWVPADCDIQIFPGSPESVAWRIPKDEIINSLLGMREDGYHPLACKLQEECLTIQGLRDELKQTEIMMNERIEREFNHD